MEGAGGLNTSWSQGKLLERDPLLQFLQDAGLIQRELPAGQGRPGLWKSCV